MGKNHTDGRMAEKTTPFSPCYCSELRRRSVGRIFLPWEGMETNYLSPFFQGIYLSRKLCNNTDGSIYIPLIIINIHKKKVPKHFSFVFCMYVWYIHTHTYIMLLHTYSNNDKPTLHLLRWGVFYIVRVLLYCYWRRCGEGINAKH